MEEAVQESEESNLATEENLDTVAQQSGPSRQTGGSSFESIYYSLASKTTPDGRIIFNDEIEILPNKELPQFASAGTKAYLAKGVQSNTEYITILCGRSEVPRVTSIGSYKNLKSENILRLVTAGIVDWPAENRQRFALIFEKINAKKLLEDPEGKVLKIHEDEIIPAIIEPAIAVLDNLQNIDMVHGAICLDNLYMSGTDGTGTLIVGECLSSAPSYHQHPIYEMVTRSMAKPSGRGPGTIKDDLYALGMCVAMLARGKNFMASKTKEEIIEDKVQNGSYGAIAGKERLPGGLSEFLRGVLNDDPNERWEVEDVFKWLEGRRLTPKGNIKKDQAARGLAFDGGEYKDLRGLAGAFANNIPAAVAEIEKGEFVIWLKRNFDDKDLKLRVEKVLNKEVNSPPERLVSAVCAAIDPYGPVRYSGLSLFPSGFGMALAEAIRKKEDVQIFGNIISQQIFSGWINNIFDELPDASGLLSTFEKCRIALNQKILGYGLERALYISNPEIACMSPVLESYYALAPSSVLLSLENIASKGGSIDKILDRHMIAFISVREPKMIDPFLGYLNSSDQGKYIIGILRILAGIQRRFRIGPLPEITKQVVSLLGPAIEAYHDKDLRQQITKQVNLVQNNGDLVAIVNIVDDGWVIQEDNNRFINAKNEYFLLSNEKAQIENYLKKRKSFGRATGRQVAMIVSTLVAVITIALYSVIHLYNRF